MKLHLLCATNGVSLSYELTAASAAEVHLVRELLAEAGLGNDITGTLLGDLAYRSAGLEKEIAARSAVGDRAGVPTASGQTAQIEICFAALKRTFGLDGTLATTLVGLATRIAAKMTARIPSCYVNRLLGRPQGRIKELWA